MCPLLKELGRVFEEDKARIRSDNATKTAQAVVQECSDVFQEMDGLLLMKVPNLKPESTDKKASAKAMLERLRWPAIKGKIELLNCNLDRMKNTLTLMLNVIIYAQQVSERNEPASVITERRQLIEILAQAKEERDKALEQTKRALKYKPVEPNNNTPFLTTTNLMAMSVGMKKSEQSQGSRDTPLVPSQARTLHTEPDKFGHIDQLLDVYTRLQKNLIDEIHSEQYMIQQDSRKRLKLWIDNAHNDEVRRLTVTCPYYYDANGEFKESEKRQMQPTRVGELAEKDAENLPQVDISDNFKSKPTDRTSNSSSQRCEITAIMPRQPASEPELKKNDGKFLPIQPKSIRRKPRDRFSEYSTTIREGVTPHPSQPTKEPLQPALKPYYEWYTVADLGAPDVNFYLDMVEMALYVDEHGSEGLARIGEKAEEDGRERGEGEGEGGGSAGGGGEEAAELVENEEANFFNSDQSWNWWSKETPDETVELKERKEHANAGYKESVADRLLAAWTTVKPVT